MSKAIELLAPAKDLQCGIAAIDHGADAVYIGATRFGARHAAGNSVEDIALLCRYAHQFGAKVYATVNTVVYDHELPEAMRLAEELHEAGVDAILVQDMGLKDTLTSLSLVSDHLTLHASTQTDNRTPEKVRWLYEQGFSRVVLARELSLEEIRRIHEAVPEVELEVFVHGALCVSYSGQCYASEYCLGRSANRGECAQMCRMKYSLEDADGKRIAPDAYYLSLKDQCQLQNLEDIIEAGACSLKIEGRLKDVAYVKNVVSAYSQRLDAIVAKSKGTLQRASWGKVHHLFTPDLQKSFNRGYTDYFLHGRTDRITSFYTPKAIGEYVGKVKELRGASFNVAGTAAFANGDGLCFFDEQGELHGFRVNRVEGNRLYPLQMPRLKAGTPLYRSQDQTFDRVMAGKTAERKIHITMLLCADDAAIGRLTLSAKGLDAPLEGRVEMTLGTLERAQKPQTENIRRQLTKLGGTIYECDEVLMEGGVDQLFIPSSRLAELRRQLVENIKVNSVNSHCASEAPAVADQVPQMPYYDTYRYLYNAENECARNFYAARGIATRTLKEHVGSGKETLLMQCRHCLRYSMGCCAKHGGQRGKWHEPLFLRLGDGRRFRLEFDCKHCQMNVIADVNG